MESMRHLKVVLTPQWFKTDDTLFNVILNLSMLEKINYPFTSLMTDQARILIFES